MTPPPLARPVGRALRIVLAACAIAGTTSASAHATVVFGTLVPTPSPPPVEAPFTLELEMEDPTGAPVEDAVVRAELSPAGPDAPAEAAADPGEPLVETRFEEVSPGRYRAELSVASPGLYQIRLRDQTFRQEEATQIVSLRVGGEEPVEPIDFLFPPTATAGGLGAWLLWLVAVPLVAGIVVTLLVLRSGDPDAAAARGAPAEREHASSSESDRAPKP